MSRSTTLFRFERAIFEFVPIGKTRRSCWPSNMSAASTRCCAPDQKIRAQGNACFCRICTNLLHKRVMPLERRIERSESEMSAITVHPLRMI